MKVLFFDTETTGLPLWKEPSDHPDQPHIVELAAELWDDSNETLIEQFSHIINIGAPVPAEMTEIHGITDEMVAEGIDPIDSFDMLKGVVAQADIIAGHNISFDIRMVRIHSARHTGLKWEPMQPTFCTMRKTTNHCKILKAAPRFSGDWKWPNLGEAYKHFTGQDFEDAHRAGPDCAAARELYFALKKVGDPK